MSDSWAKRILITDGGCWDWTGRLSADGYASCHAREGSRVHRVLWIRENGLVPDGMELDHTCRRRACVNPAHLEPVTHLENHRRSAVGKLTEADVIEIRRSSEPTEILAGRYGVTYVTAYQARVGISWAAVDAKAVPFPSKARPRPSHCGAGHEFTPENTRVEKYGKRKCRRCCAERARRSRAKGHGEGGHG